MDHYSVIWQNLIDQAYYLCDLGLYSTHTIDTNWLLFHSLPAGMKNIAKGCKTICLACNSVNFGPGLFYCVVTTLTNILHQPNKYEFNKNKYIKTTLKWFKMFVTNWKPKFDSYYEMHSEI